MTIFASSFQHHTHKEAKLSTGTKWKTEEVNGVQLVWIRTPRYQSNNWRRVVNMVSYMVSSWRLGRHLPEFESQVRRPDTVIGSSPHLLAVVSAWRLARYHKTQFIMEVRDLWPETLIDMGYLASRSPVTWLLRALESFLYRSADYIITVLPRAHEYIESRGIDSDKIAWIPNGVDLSRYAKPRATASPGAVFTVMYVGAHGEANGLGTLLNAAKAVQDREGITTRFVLVGDGPEKPSLLKQAARLSLRNVAFYPPVPRIEVPKVLASADATVLVLNDLPLYRYGISLNKLSDYLAAGKPIIFAGNSANNPVAEARCGLTVPPEDVGALATAVIALSRTPLEERRMMGERGREYAEQHYAMSLLAEKFAQCIDID